MYIEQALQHTKEKGRFRRVCYLAVSLFANDGDEEVEGRHAPTTIKINSYSILIPTLL